MLFEISHLIFLSLMFSFEIHWSQHTERVCICGIAEQDDEAHE
jgi:hypothetical protein